jgi:hypothetical protein
MEKSNSSEELQIEDSQMFTDEAQEQDIDAEKEN